MVAMVLTVRVGVGDEVVEVVAGRHALFMAGRVLPLGGLLPSVRGLLTQRWLSKVELKHWEHPSGDRSGWGFTHNRGATASVPWFGIRVGLDAKPGGPLLKCDLDCVIP